MVKYTVEVPDMRCQGCANMLREEITSLQGVTNVEANPAADELVAHGEAGMEDRIRQAVTEKGYTAAR